MAPQAYVFVCATPGKVEETASAIAKVEGVKSAHSCLIQCVPRFEATDTRIVVEV
jgi:hypothetical protein